MFGALHRPEQWASDLEDARRVAELVTAMGARHVVLLPADVGPSAPELEPEQWRTLVDATSELGRILKEDYGVTAVFHPHADSVVGTQPQVERFLADTHPETVSLCLDTGHIAYYGGDNVELIHKYPDRIGYLHMKQADPAVLEQVRKEHLGFGEACRRGAMCEPPRGVPAVEPLLEAVDGLDGDFFMIVEQDLYPCDPDVPLPIARRTYDYLRRHGVGVPATGR